MIYFRNLKHALNNEFHARDLKNVFTGGEALNSQVYES